MPSANSLFLPKRLADAYFTGSYKMLLVSSAPSESDLDTFDFRSDIANEVAASGTYATGGAAVTCTVSAVDTANNRVSVTFGAPAAFTSATISAVGGWIYKAVGSAATDELVTYVDFGGTVTSTAGTFTVTLSTPLYVNR
jgi:hypothetical protein